MRVSTCVPVLTLPLVLALAGSAHAQTTPPPHQIWTVNASAGIASTAGNTDTSTINAAYDFVYDPLTKNIVKSDALYLRGKNNDQLAADRLNWNIRDQYRINGRTYVFAQNQYLRDKFKQIDYLIAPTGGIGYKVLDTPESKLDVDAGIGGVFEKNPGFDVRKSGAVTFGEKFVQKLTSTATFTQSFAGLWKTSDFDDSLYTIGAGIAVSISARTQLKFEVLDVYKNKPPLATLKKNDIATLMAIVLKI